MNDDKRSFLEHVTQLALEFDLECGKYPEHEFEGRTFALFVMAKEGISIEHREQINALGVWEAMLLKAQQRNEP